MKFNPQSKKYLRLLIIFTKMEFQTKYHGSILGFAWYFANPILTFAMLYLIFAKRFGEGIENYPIYLLIGIIQWNFFQSAVSKSLRAILENHALIKSINFPREITVIAPVIVTLFSHTIELLILTIIMVYLKMNITYIIFLPPIIILQTLFALGISLALSSIVVYISDVLYAWTYLSRLWWIGTPIFYLASEESRLFFININLNPQFQFIHATRGLLINHSLPSLPLAITMTAISIITFIAGYTIFNKLKKRFAELI